MSDPVAEYWQIQNEEKRRRHRTWNVENHTALKNSGLKYEKSNNGQECLFRESGKPVVNFYPSTGRWYLPHENRTMKGGAEKFIEWYRGQQQCQQK